jgi:preprotein translocase subunit SecE
MQQNIIWIIVWSVLVLGVFGWLWKTGQLMRFAAYVEGTKEELRKCSWPTVEELKGSTVVVFISIAILGAFTMLVDFVFSLVVQHI